MSSGKSLGAESEIESSLINRISRIENRLCAIKPLEDQASDWLIKLQDIVSEISSIYENVTMALKERDGKIYNLSSFVDSNFKSIFSLENSVKDLTQSHESHVQGFSLGLQRISEKVDSSLADHPKIVDFSNLQNDLNDRFKALRSWIESIKDSINEIQGDLVSLRGEVQAHDANFAEQQQDFVFIKSLFEKHKSEIDQRLSIASAQNELRAKAILDKHVKDMEALRDDLKGSPNALESVKQDILQQIESASLDASNAVIKAANVDSQQKIIERKIENIQLLLKKYELAK